MKRVRSLVVNSKDDSSAEKGVILIRITRVVIICVIPKALGGNANTLACHLTNDTLNDNLVTGNMAFIFDLLSDGINDLFRPMFGMCVIVFFFI